MISRVGAELLLGQLINVNYYDNKYVFAQSFVEQHALPRGSKSNILVSFSSLPVSISRVTLPCDQVYKEESIIN